MAGCQEDVEDGFDPEDPFLKNFPMQHQMFPENLEFEDPRGKLKTGQDPYVKSSYVFHLTQVNFKQFLQKYNAVMVLFYDEGMKDKTLINRFARDNFIKAAKTTKRPFSTYATVDCTKSCNLCKSENVDKFPLYRIYSGGKLVSRMDPGSMDAQTIRKFVEITPVAK